MRSGMRVHASWPLVSLSIGPGQLCLRGRGPFRKLFRDGVLDPAQVSAEAVRGFSSGGVVLSVKGHDKWVFWTWERDKVLSALGEQGAKVVPGERRVKWSDTMGY
jgi:hypothetical protein